MSDVTALLKQFTARYRTALLTKVGLLLVLGVGAIALLAWRLHAAGMSSAWSLGPTALVAVLAGVAAGWWIRRRWIAPHDAAAHLDRVLNLQERLTTADEFARAEQAPALYSLLVDDVSRSFSAQRAQFPKAYDRTTGVLAVALLFLLLIPFKGKAPLQLAGLIPHPAAPTPPPPTPTPPPPEPSSQQQQQQQQNQQPSSASPSQDSSGGQGGEAQSSSAGASSQPQGGQDQSPQHGGPSGQSQPGREAGASQPQSGGNSTPSQGTPRDNTQGPPSGDARSNGLNQSTQQQASGGQEQPQRAAQQAASPGGAGQGQQSQPANGSGQQAAPGQGQQQAAQTQRSSASSGSSAGTSNVSGASAKGQGTAQPASSAATTQQQPGSGSPGTSGSAGTQRAPSGGGTSPGSQEALKGEIQGLLKELSGELKDLEAQLASAKTEAHPQAGADTDPQLYGASEAMPPRGTTPVPLQLNTDTAPTSSQRAGSGIAPPSGQVSKSGPQVKNENAALSEEPAEESAVTRQVVPPEYRSVFDNLHQQSSQPSETKHNE